MKKKFLLYTLGFSIIFFIVFLINKPVTDVEEVFLLPEGYQGCAWIYYNQPKAKSLVIKNKEINYLFSENGLLHTSSPSDFGNLGWHEFKAFYVNSKGEVLEEIPYTDYKLGGLSSNGLSERRWIKFRPNISNLDVCK